MDDGGPGESLDVLPENVMPPRESLVQLTPPQLAPSANYAAAPPPMLGQVPELSIAPPPNVASISSVLPQAAPVASSVETGSPSLALGQPLTRREARLVAAPVSTAVDACPRAEPTEVHRAKDDPSGVAFEFGLQSSRVAPRTTALEWMSLLFAVVVPPLGFVLSMLARGLAFRARRWTTPIGKVATVLSIIFTIVAGFAYFVYADFAQRADARSALVTQSGPLCQLASDNPGIMQSPTFGWPAPVGTLTETIEAMHVFEQRWIELSETAPAAVKADVAAVAAAATTFATETEASRVLNDGSNVERMTLIVSASSVPAWVAEYCE